MPFASQNTVAICWQGDGLSILCLGTFLASGTQALPIDDSELYSLAHNNEPKSILQSADAKENHLLT